MAKNIDSLIPKIYVNWDCWDSTIVINLEKVKEGIFGYLYKKRTHLCAIPYYRNNGDEGITKYMNLVVPLVEAYAETHGAEIVYESFLKDFIEK